MAKKAIFKMAAVRFWWNLVHYIRYWTRLQSRDQKLKFLKFKMAAQIAFLAINHRPIVRFQWNFVWGSKTAGRSSRATWQKLQIFKIQHGGQRLFWKLLNRHISVKNRPILMKFCTLHQILNRLQSRDQKLKFLEFKMAATAILNSLFWP